MNWYRSWPETVPPGRAYVHDSLPRLPMHNHDYATIDRLPDDEPGWCLLEWDVALDARERDRFADIALRTPDRPLVAPYYKTYHRGEGPRCVHLLVGNPNRPLPDGEPFTNLFGFGCIYFPQRLIREFLATKPAGHSARHWRFNDTRFSRWYFQNYGETPVIWNVHPQHLHGD